MNFHPGIVCALLASIGMSSESRYDGEANDSLKEGLELHLPFDKGFADQSENSHGTRIRGEVKIDPEGRGARFGGKGNYLELPAFDLAEKNFSISFWVEVTGENGGYAIAEQKSPNGGKRKFLHLLLRNPQRPYFGFFMNDLKGKSMIRRIDGRRHVVFQYQDGEMQIWLDGRLDVSAKRKSFLGNGGNFFIGRGPSWSNVPTKPLEGYLRDFRIYSRALSSVEIGALSLMNL